MIIPQDNIYCQVSIKKRDELRKRLVKADAAEKEDKNGKASMTKKRDSVDYLLCARSERRRQLIKF